MHTRVIFILEQKEGETGKQQEREKERKSECECGSVAEKWILMSVIKLAVGKTHWPVFGISWKGLPFSGKLF
jgi:hypothetical protein